VVHVGDEHDLHEVRSGLQHGGWGARGYDLPADAA
jgi:hypothetical protein